MPCASCPTEYCAVGTFFVLRFRSRSPSLSVVSFEQECVTRRSNLIVTLYYIAKAQTLACTEPLAAESRAAGRRPCHTRPRRRSRSRRAHRAAPSCFSETGREAGRWRARQPRVPACSASASARVARGEMRVGEGRYYCWYHVAAAARRRRCRR